MSLGGPNNFYDSTNTLKYDYSIVGVPSSPEPLRLVYYTNRSINAAENHVARL